MAGTGASLTVASARTSTASPSPRTGTWCLPPGTPNGRGNHSCDPSSWWVDACTLAARRDVAASEEVTNDYATSTTHEGFSLVCACSTRLCRGLVTGRDWQRTELRDRYGRHWVPAVLARIDTATLP